MEAALEVSRTPTRDGVKPGLVDQLVFEARLVDDLDQSGETAGLQFGEAVDRPVRRAVATDGQRLGQAGDTAAEPGLARGQSVDAPAEIRVDGFSRRALLDR